MKVSSEFCILTRKVIFCDYFYLQKTATGLLLKNLDYLSPVRILSEIVLAACNISNYHVEVSMTFGSSKIGLKFACAVLPSYISDLERQYQSQQCSVKEVSVNCN